MRRGIPASVPGVHVVFFNWRDTRNPEGGGSERYVEQMARGIVEHGGSATVFCAAHDRAPADEVVDGVRFVRRGTKMAVYLRGVEHLLLRRFGRVDLVVDVQNGLPFFTRLATRVPVVVLVHHVHREQWPVVYPGLTGRLGWWIERWLAPRLYRRSQYVAVSRATRDELVLLGVDRDRIAVVHNGTEPPPDVTSTRSPYPTVCVVGRLVPHKRVEHAIEAVASLRAEIPDLRLLVVGDGWWHDELVDAVKALDVVDAVTMTGHVSEQRKHELYAESWVMALPSLKEGWGLVVGEAGMHGAPTVAYTSAGGTQESVAHGWSGLLVDDQAAFTGALRDVLTDAELRRRLGTGARLVADGYTWRHSRGSFAQVVHDVLAGRVADPEDPDERLSTG